MNGETRIELVHRVRVETDHRVYGLGCRAVCLCGWASGWTDHGPRATEAGAEHIDTAIGPPDEMDRAMGAMLDLQVDLAEVVVWLAENWSADLPAPGVSGSSRYRDGGESVATVRLLCYCLTGEQLAEAARRLGVPVIDAEPDSKGHRYRRAVRAFGLVTIEAYTEAPEPSGAVP
jgi:hypothetical protein